MQWWLDFACTPVCNDRCHFIRRRLNLSGGLLDKFPDSMIDFEQTTVKMDASQQFLDTIAGDIRQLQTSMKAHLPMLEQAVNLIITRQSSDPKEIEHLLDSLLDFQQMGIGEALFIRMLEYYKHLDPEAAADYWEYFDKME